MTESDISNENSPLPEPAVDPAPPPACPVCFLTPNEQREVLRGDRRDWSARCVPGQCVVLGIAWPVHGDGTPVATFWPRYNK